ncbi:MAG: bacteriocin-protection protein, YdeI/OmpD-associated family [bacterium]
MIHPHALPTSQGDMPIYDFETSRAFDSWISTHYTQTASVWLRFYNKGTGVPTISYQEALDIALCWGWIDSQIKKVDPISCIRKFSPRRPKSIWSQMNKSHVERLIATGLMQPAGLAEVKKAKDDGRWEAAYVGQRDAALPSDLTTWTQEQRAAVKDFVANLSRSQVFSIYFQLSTAKKLETRQRRLDAIKAALLKLQNPY